MMKKEPPVKLYLFVTISVFIIITFIGVIIKNYISEKFPSKIVKEENVVQNTEPEEIRQSKYIFYFGGLLLIILVVIFIIFKMALRKTS